jgi:hypothetical protein
VVDPFPPSIIDVEPRGTNVSVDSVIRITFSEPMDDVSIHGAFSISPYVPGSLSWDGDTLVFTPNGNLDTDTVYNITMDGSAEDRGGNAMGVDYTWEFKTGLKDVTEGEQTPLEMWLAMVFVIIFILFILFLIYELRSHWLGGGKKPAEEPESGAEEGTIEKTGQDAPEGPDSRAGEDGGEP